MDRVTHFAVAAAKLAIEDAKLDMSKENPLRCGVCVGSGIGGIHTFLEQSLKLGSKGPSKISPFFIPMEIPNMSAGQIAIATGLKGPNTAIVTACATGTNCIGDALRTIQYGDADVMLAGGTEAAVSPIAIAGFANMKALSTNNENPEAASCPFDKNPFLLIRTGAALLWVKAQAFWFLKSWSMLKLVAHTSMLSWQALL